MKEILILTGACGVGKTTTAKEWAISKNGAIIECDYLTEWIFQKEFPHWTLEEEKLTVSMASKMAMEYLNFGMSVAIENVWSPSGIERVKNNLTALGEVKIKAVWLRCDLNENHQRDQQRQPENRMNERVEVVNKELAAYEWSNFVHQLDTTHLSPAEVIKAIDLLS